MKFRCERDELLEAVQFATRAISNRATLPVLAGLRIEAKEDGEVAVAATDLELTMESAFKAAVDDPGIAIVPGRLFGDMTRSLGAGQVSLALGDAEVEIDSGRGRFRVKAMSVEDYPALPIEDRAELSEATSVEIDGSLLATALSQVVRSASPDESRQVLTGVLWEIGPETLTLAATDSYRLSVRNLAVKGGSTEAHKVVLPARSLAELARALQGAATEVRVSLRDNLMVFLVRRNPESGTGAEESVIGSRFIEGEFPNYKQLLPTGYTNVLTVPREALLEVVRRVGLLAQNSMPVKLQLGTELEISAHTPDVGEGQEIIDATYEGESLVIAFNPQFLADGGAAIQGDRLVLRVGDGLKPALLEDADDDTFTYLLMPVRIS
jgi:DNA polymerase III subunit beta